jgi:hypothetical protein
MLGVTRADAERLCLAVGHRWVVDSTNADESRLRSALRARVVPELKRLSPLVAQKVAATSQLLGESAALVRRRARRVLGSGQKTGVTLVWQRRVLACEPAVVLGELLRLSVTAARKGEGMDRLGYRVLRSAARAMRDESTEPREFAWGHLRLVVHASEVRLEVT